MSTVSRSLSVALLAAAPVLVHAQAGTSHAGHAEHARQGQPANPSGSLPTLPGQDAYGAIGEVVRILEADSTTDWSKVDLERLRQHLINMNELTLKSVVRKRVVDGGLQMDVTGDAPRTGEAIRMMTASHGSQLGAYGMVTTSEPIRGGARFTVRAQDPADARLVAKIRGLGFIGVMTLGNHHAPHHLAMARGGTVAGHGAGH